MHQRRGSDTSVISHYTISTLIAITFVVNALYCQTLKTQAPEIAFLEDDPPVALFPDGGEIAAYGLSLLRQPRQSEGQPAAFRRAPPERRP
jgi:hypothetical protein